MDGDFAKSLKGKLDPEQYDICVNKGTEPAFTGKYHDSKELGTYRCVCCNVVLFKSDKKFNSGTGWPSFSDVIDKENVEYVQDSSFGTLPPCYQILQLCGAVNRASRIALWL